VLGTGDLTHPAWRDELKGTLVPAEAGLLRLRPELERDLRRPVPAACEQPVRFMLSAEISTIYRREEHTRKVHHLIYAPTFEAADRITASGSKIGNLASDGRPILGLDSRDLLEITLEAGPGCHLVPAHIWTPWFAVLGSRSGFDAVADCYGDLAGEIFAAETGLSSDPRMNWMCSSLDAYRLVSNSDAHSPPALGSCTGSLNSQTARMASAPGVPRTSIISLRLRKLLARSCPWGRRARALTRSLTGLSPAFGPELAILQEVPADNLAGIAVRYRRNGAYRDDQPATPGRGHQGRRIRRRVWPGPPVPSP
jgi:PHP family Zn ribbon phosphoesterase